MINNNYSVDLPKIEEVRYLNNEIPSYEEFVKTWKKWAYFVRFVVRKSLLISNKTYQWPVNILIKKN